MLCRFISSDINQKMNVSYYCNSHASPISFFAWYTCIIFQLYRLINLSIHVLIANLLCSIDSIFHHYTFILSIIIFKKKNDNQLCVIFFKYTYMYSWLSLFTSFKKIHFTQEFNKSFYKRIRIFFSAIMNFVGNN